MNYQGLFDYSRGSIVRKIYQNHNRTPLFQLIFAFTMGMLIAPWGSGLFFIVLFYILGEILYYLFTGGDPRYWQVELRFGCLFGSLLGWIVGRTLAGLEVMVLGFPQGNGGQIYKSMFKNSDLNF